MDCALHTNKEKIKLRIQKNPLLLLRHKWLHLAWILLLLLVMLSAVECPTFTPGSNKALLM